MKLLLALYLLSLFFYSVSMLQCLKCESKSDQCIDTLTQQCGPDELCGYSASSMNSLEHENKTEVKRECVERKVCDQFGAVGKDVFATMNGGLENVSIFMYCCESDNCNNITTPEPDTKPNGLKCLTCNSYTDRFCNSTVPCVGNQDHCLSFKVLFFLGLEYPMGCISKPLCGLSKSLFGQFKCCSENLCNKRQSLDQSTPQN